MALLRPEVRAALGDGREVVVRSAVPRDARALTALLDDVAAEPDGGLLLVPGEIGRREWRRRIADNLRAPETLFAVAEIGGERLVACLGLHPDPHRRSPHVRQMGMSVARPLRRLGLGDLLVETALEWARGRGVVKIELGVFADNAAARALYEKHGFVVEGLRRVQYLRGGEYRDEILMAWFAPEKDS